MKVERVCPAFKKFGAAERMNNAKVEVMVDKKPIDNLREAVTGLQESLGAELAELTSGNLPPDPFSAFYNLQGKALYGAALMQSFGKLGPDMHNENSAPLMKKWLRGLPGYTSPDTGAAETQQRDVNERRLQPLIKSE